MGIMQDAKSDAQGGAARDDCKRITIIEHEIKNQITVISAIVDRLESFSTDSGFKKDINYIKAALNDCESLMSVSVQNNDIRKTIVNIHRLIEEAADIFSGNNKILIKTKLHAKIHLFLGSKEILKSTLGNIIINAVQASSEKGRIIIKTYNKDETIYIDIQDNGDGIKEELLSNIFNQGFTTKTGGSGIGLYSAKENIESCGGRIYAVSKEGRGAKFTIILPIYVE